METKVIATFALVIVAAILISSSECQPLSDPLGPSPADTQEVFHLRQGRQYLGYPYGGGYGGIGGLGGYGGGSSSAAAAAASSSSGVGGLGGFGGYPYGK